MARDPLRPSPRRIDRRLDPRLEYLLHLRHQGVLEARQQADATRFAAQRQKLTEFRAALSQELRGGTAPKVETVQGLREKIAAERGRIQIPVTAGLHDPLREKSFATRRANLSEPFVSCLAWSTDPDPKKAAATFTARGAKVRAVSGRVCVLYLPLSQVREILKPGGAKYLEIARALVPDLGTAVPATGLSTWHGKGKRGRGAILGVIDDSLDVHHPDFRSDDGRTRIRYLWVQDPGGPLLEGEAGPLTDGSLPGVLVGGGVEYSRADIQAELDAGDTSFAARYQKVRHEPKSAHGTAVTGCAAGNGRAWRKYQEAQRTGSTESREGAAPEAEILFVSYAEVTGTEGFADSANVLEAIAYVFARADTETDHPPCVVNLSASDNQGAHDGTSLGEQFLDGLLAEPRRAITLSAGNSHKTQCHVQGTVAPGETVSLSLEYFAQNGEMPAHPDAIDLWYEGQTTLAAIVTPPAPATAIKIAPPASADAPPNQETLAIGAVEVVVTSVRNDPTNGDNRILIRIEVPAGAHVPLGTWTLELTHLSGPQAEFHGWIDRNNRGRVNWKSSDYLTQGEKTGTIAVPSTARLPITVGGHLNKSPFGATAGGASSGRGPVRGNAFTKPDIAAPDRFLMAPCPTNLAIDPEVPYAVAGGTSMAAPIVAGACALLLLENPTWGVEQVRDRLIADAKGFSGLAAPDQALGWGRLHLA
jgi:subtilisin family serine protease